MSWKKSEKSYSSRNKGSNILLNLTRQYSWCVLYRSDGFFRRYVKVEESEAQIRESAFLPTARENGRINHYFYSQWASCKWLGRDDVQRSSLWQCFRNIRNPLWSTTQNKGDKFKSNICSLYESLAQSCGRSCSGIFRTLWYLFTPISRNVILFIRQASTAYRALQKVSKPVEIHLLQWHSSVISIHNRHLDFCTATNVHKNILAIMLWPA